MTFNPHDSFAIEPATKVRHLSDDFKASGLLRKIFSCVNDAAYEGKYETTYSFLEYEEKYTAKVVRIFNDMGYKVEQRLVRSNQTILNINWE